MGLKELLKFLTFFHHIKDITQNICKKVQQ